MTINEQPIGDLKVKRIPDACYDCGNVIPRGGAVILGESGQMICQKCLSHVLGDAGRDQQLSLRSKA